MALKQCDSCGGKSYVCDKCEAEIERPQPLYLHPPYGSLNAKHVKILCDTCYWTQVRMVWEWLGLDTAPIDKQLFDIQSPLAGGSA